MIRTVVLNLPHRQDRLRQFQVSYQKSGWAALLGAPQVFAAVDGQQTPLPASWQDYLPGTYGCHLSHLQLIEQAIADNVEQLFVFEDDALFRPHSIGQLNWFMAMVPSLDALWFGGQYLGSELPSLAESFRKASRIYRTHAYALSRKTMRTIYPSLLDAVGPIDVSFVRCLQGTDVYCPQPLLVGQRAGRSDITGLQECERWWREI